MARTRGGRFRSYILRRASPWLLRSATAVLLTPIGLGIAPMSIAARAQQNQLPSCDVKSPRWDNCRGSQQYPIGVYVGEFHNGKPNGQGTMTFADFDKYVGEFKDGIPNGQGTLILPTGEKFVGEFKDRTLKVTLPNGEIEYFLELKGGKLKVTLPNGLEYVQEYKDGKLNGQTTLTWPNGDKYVGEFKNGKSDGQGTFTGRNGEKYVGGFKDGKRNGQGTLYAADGSIRFSGVWASSEVVGAVASQELIAMEKEGGVYVVPVLFNGAITLNAIVDSGAADVSVPADIVSTLIRTKTLSDQDFLGVQTYVLADGTEVPSPRFRIRSLKVGNKTLENVTASIASGNADILLGQSFLGKFNSWSVDNDRHVLIIR